MSFSTSGRNRPEGQCCIPVTLGKIELNGHVQVAGGPQRRRKNRLNSLELVKSRCISSSCDILEVIEDDCLIRTPDVRPEAERLALLIVDNVVGEVGEGGNDLVGGIVGEGDEASI